MSKNIYAIIPARGGSQRLKRKNIYPIAGKPMLYWAVAACQRSRYIQRAFVSTEDEEIKEVAQSVGAGIIDRPADLAGDKVFKQHVICHGMKYLQENLGLQPVTISAARSRPTHPKSMPPI